MYVTGGLVQRLEHPVVARIMEVRFFCPPPKLEDKVKLLKALVLIALFTLLVKAIGVADELSLSLQDERHVGFLLAKVDELETHFGVLAETLSLHMVRVNNVSKELRALFAKYRGGVSSVVADPSWQDEFRVWVEGNFEGMTDEVLGE